MKRNVYLILITVITILCIIAGTGYHLVRFGLSVAEGLPSFSEFIEAISDWDDDGDDSDDSDDNDDSDNGISTSVDTSQKSGCLLIHQCRLKCCRFNHPAGEHFFHHLQSQQKAYPGI